MFIEYKTFHYEKPHMQINPFLALSINNSYTTSLEMKELYTNCFATLQFKNESLFIVAKVQWKSIIIVDCESTCHVIK